MDTFLTLKTEYSITRSTITVKEGINLAKKNGYKAVLMADDYNLFAALDFANEAIKAKILPIIGVKVKVEFKGVLKFLTLVAKNKEGFEGLLKLTSNSVLVSKTPWVVELAELKDCLQGGVLEAPKPSPHSSPSGRGGTPIIIMLSEPDEELINELLVVKEDFYLQISRLSNKEEDVAREKALLELALKLDLPIIYSNEAYFQTEEMFEANDVLKCVGEGRFFLEDDREKFSPNNYFKSPEEIAKLFEDLPEALENAENLKYKISFAPKNSKPLLPSFAEDEKAVMFEMAKKGLEERIANGELLGLGHGYTREDYEKRLEYEVEVIAGMGFCGYFLIVADFIVWSKKNDIPVGPGRGSGAGSIVAYALRITDIDPLHYGLLFERFLNPERVSMPDFDVDFCQEGRERVINYVKEKYGAESVAGIITFGRLQARAVLKDVGRVMQVPYIVVDKICKMIPFNPIEPVSLGKAIELDPELQKKREEDETIAKLLELGLSLEGLIRHSSAHAAGLIIADRPLIKLVPLFKAEEEGLPVVGYHMKAAELAGLVKFDFLGLKTLTIIANACKFVKRQTGQSLDITKIPLKDEKTFKLLQEGLTLGIFQLESLVCRDAMKKMKIDKMEDIIALTSLNRPGPMENIPSYINRKLGKEAISYPHIILKELLEETYGIIIYQEQVIKIAQVLAGYSLGQADLLRRAMGKKIKEEMEAQRKVFVEGAVKNNVPEAQASEIFDLVDKFAGYGFNKSHAAAYSAISYQTAYLKAHFPVQFFVANLNMSIGDTDDLNLFINDARSLGIKINLPSINASGAFFETDGKEIFYGLGALKSVGIGSISEVVEIRSREGEFVDIFDFCKRVGHRNANKKQLEALTKAGAFDCLNVNRKQILTSVDVLVNYASGEKKESMELSLFGEQEITLPKLAHTVGDFTLQEKLTNEFEAVGFYLSFHPLNSFKEKLEEAGFVSFRNLEELLEGEREKRFKMAGVVSIVKQRSGARGRFAFVHLSEVSGIFEASIFKDELITKHREELQAGKLIAVTVSASKQENGSLRIIINEIFPLEEFLISNNGKNHLKDSKPRKNYAAKPAVQAPETIVNSTPLQEELYKPSLLRFKMEEFEGKLLFELSKNLSQYKSPQGKTVVRFEMKDKKFLLAEKYNIPVSFVEKLRQNNILCFDEL